MDGNLKFAKLPKQLEVNLRFKDIKYETSSFTQNSKMLLNGVSGEFKAGELTAIMGPSGSGKTTLLNILAGFRLRRTSGHIKINNIPLKKDSSQSVSRYVLQEDHVKPQFTTWETMMFASHFKMGGKCAPQVRRKRIMEILQLFHLAEQRDTKIAHLSGGQRKRVCIALELLDRPAVVFLDEPTTGLDEFSAAQIVGNLKNLAQSGRTIVCSIHGPSARLFGMFDKAYILARGQCIYQGPVTHIVDYLKYFNLNCPVTYNPADFIIEVASSDYGDFHYHMVKEMRNGGVSTWSPGGDMEQYDNTFELNRLENRDFDHQILISGIGNSWCFEFKWLLRRYFHEMAIDKNVITMRFVIHICLAMLIGLTYYDIGNNGNLAMLHYHLCLLSGVLAIYIPTTTMGAYVPQDMQYLRREHFNRWYRLSSYFVALLMAQFPFTILSAITSSVILYVMAGQPMEFFRFVLFTGVNFLTSLVGGSYGIAMGCRFKLLNALFVGPTIMSFFIILSHHALETTHLPLINMIIMYFSCMRHSMEGFLAALLKFNRATIPCPPDKVFCVMSKPDFILKTAGSRNIDYFRSAAFLVGFYLAFSLIAFTVLKSRLEATQLLEKYRLYRFIRHVVRTCVYVKIGNEKLRE